MTNPFLDEVRRRRGEMRDSISALELALSAPAARDRRRWADRAHAALVELSADLRTHVRITEEPDGLHSEVIAAAPRLVEATSRLAAEHVTIRDQLDELTRRAEKAESMEDVTVIRDLGIELLASLMHHRQHGAELVYEAYQFDVGGDS